MRALDLYDINLNLLDLYLKKFGYCYFKNYDASIIEKLFSQTRDFFSKDQDYKNKYEVTRNGPFSKKYDKLGYFYPEEETVASSFQKQNENIYSTINTKCEANQEFEASPGDLKESFNIHEVLSVRDYPDLKNFKYDCLNGKNYLYSISLTILLSLEKLLNLNNGELQSQHISTNEGFTGSVLRLIHYPMYEEVVENAYRIGKHRDGTTFTLIFHDDIYSDLQRYDNEQWIDIEDKKDCFIFHTGWNLQKISNKKYNAMIHRVNNKNINKSRYSLLYFFALNKKINEK